MLFFLIFFMPSTALDAADLTQINRCIQQQAEQYNLSPELIKAVILKESSYNCNASNNKGDCIGLMQINADNTAPWIAETLGMKKYNLTDAADNIAIGCYYLDYLRSYWAALDLSDEDVLPLMLLSYNRGITGCKRWVANHENMYSDNYVKKVMVYKYEYEQGKR